MSKKEDMELKILELILTPKVGRLWELTDFINGDLNLFRDNADYFRQYYLSNASLAYNYASLVDCAPRRDTFEVCLGHSIYSYLYFRDVLRAPSKEVEETLKSPYIYFYKKDIEEFNGKVDEFDWSLCK